LSQHPFSFALEKIKNNTMINQLANLKWLSVLLAFLPYFFLGALWFTKQYKVSLGRANETLQNNAPFL
jgi:hypothetical protein